MPEQGLTKSDLEFIDRLDRTNVSPDIMFDGERGGVFRASLDEIAQELRIHQGWIDTSPELAQQEENILERLYGDHGYDPVKYPHADEDAVQMFGPMPRTSEGVEDLKRRSHDQDKADIARINQIVSKIEDILGVARGTYAYRGSPR